MPYYGELKCESIKKGGDKCENGAYFDIAGHYYCGMHSRQNPARKQLPKNPIREKKIRGPTIKHDPADMSEYDTAAKENRDAGRRGNIKVTKIAMMKSPVETSGFFPIYPNFKHRHFSLSPKSMGPVDHGQPGLPQAKNLENFHQGNKCFASELAGNEPGDAFFATQLAMYNDPVPHRHKDAAKSISGNKNIPAFSIWRDKSGAVHKLTYFESRQFYCTFYERFAAKDPLFVKFREMHLAGYNLEIFGYDAYQPGADIEKNYLDISKPFGHELVLYTMIFCEPRDYPWRKYIMFEF